MFGSSWSTSPSGWWSVGDKSAFNFREGWLHNCSWFYYDCHRLGKNNDRVIIKFSRRKSCKQVLQVKKDLKDLSTDDLDLTKGRKNFVNQSLCSYYHILWSKSKQLHSMSIIISFFISEGTIKVKITENSRPLAITQLSDFTVNFPNVDLSPPSVSS